MNDVCIKHPELLGAKDKYGKCNLCHLEYCKEYYKNNKEASYLRNKKSEIKNKEKIRERQSLYRHKNKEHIKEVQVKWMLENYDSKKDKYNIVKKIYYLKNKEVLSQKHKLWIASNKEKHRELMKLWSINNKDKCVAFVASRKAAKLKATPMWANEFFIKEIYHLAKLRERICGGKWHVDHIVPLQSKFVCGLHVEHNLRVVSSTINLVKGNRFWPDMPLEENFNAYS